jgi:hypothetical protein
MTAHDDTIAIVIPITEGVPIAEAVAIAPTD